MLGAQDALPVQLGARNGLHRQGTLRLDALDAGARDLDALRETAAGAGKIGTTGRGIGPAYEDKVARRAIRLQDLFRPVRFAQKLQELLDFLDEAQLDRVGCFTYSPGEGAVANELGEAIPEEVKSRNFLIIKANFWIITIQVY